MSDGAKHDAITRFKDITKADHERAKFYMESSNWDLDTALGNYLDDTDNELPNDPDVSATRRSNFFDENELRNDADSETHSPAIPQAPHRSSSDSQKPTKKPASKPSGNVRTLSSLQPNQDSQESSEEEDGQAFYAGGSEHSGQQVLGPPRRRTDIVTDVFRSVRQFGAEVVESQPSHSRGSSLRGAFFGTGYRLGETANDSEVIAPKKTEDQSQVAITLRFWKNGFSVNDGPLRSFDDPKNADFLHHIKHGEVPSELLAQAQGREISFNMEDYRHAEYVNTGPKVASFTGAGQKLGSVTPTLTSPSPASNATDKSNEVQSNPVEVDKTKPTTSIQIRLADGSRLVGTFNNHHTIGDIRRFIDASSPQSGERGYILLSSFPRKELVKNDETIEESGLVNSVVMQHFVS